ncbi:MFS transporter [Aliidongia dinghuensis]|uniref:MFS transporter n=1 Tax=Aliidongia dinghuensis TaxID=1867774 RepID=A0A8J2YQW5_9PROT|nr:MFS transporter [Aliidongia dinghuensis]GGF08704.1 MFS transporter [Aliidongia dinghuensis]
MSATVLGPASPKARADRRHRWKVLAVGVAANASFAAAFSGLPTTAVFMRAAYDLNNALLGLVLGLLGLGIALSELPWGLLTDRWGDRRVLLLGLGTTALALAMMALVAAPSPGAAPPRGLLAAGMLLVGLLGGSVNGSSGRAVMAWFREGERGLAMSIRQTALPAGGGLGALVLPPLAATHGFAVVFGGLAGLCALATLAAARWLGEPPVEAAAAGDPSMAGSGPLRSTAIWRVATGIGLLCVPQLAVLTFGAIFLHDFAGVGVAVTSGALVVVQVGAGILRVWSGHWTDRRRNRRAYLRGCALASAGLFLSLGLLTATLGPAAWWWSVSLLTFGGVIASAWNGIAFTELASLAGAARAGTALALGNSFAFLTLFLTPLAIPVLLAWSAWPTVWIAAAGSALAASAVFPPQAFPGAVSRDRGARP